MTLVLSCIWGDTEHGSRSRNWYFAVKLAGIGSLSDDIPTQVYQFRLTGEVGVATASFVSVFKNRAGHFVQALLEHPQLVGGRAMEVVATWEEVEREKSWGSFDQRCMLSDTSPAYTAIELVRPLMKPLDAFTKDSRVHGQFFKSVSLSGGISNVRREVASIFKHGPLAAPGLTFGLIRKSYLQLMLRVVGSVESLRVHAGHSGTSVLLPHYLNSVEVRRELEQSTRFFQNAVQALVTEEVGGSLKLLMPDVDHEWFYNLARISGVASGRWLWRVDSGRGAASALFYTVGRECQSAAGARNVTRCRREDSRPASDGRWSRHPCADSSRRYFRSSRQQACQVLSSASEQS